MRACLVEALRHLPDDSRVLCLQGQICRKFREYAKAEDYLRKSLERNPNDWRTHAQLGETLRIQNRIEEALGSVLRAHNLDPTRASLRIGAGMILGDLDFPDEALEFLEMGGEPPSPREQAEPLEATRQAFIGQILCLTGRYVESLPHLDAAIKLAPANDWFHGLRGWALQQLLSPRTRWPPTARPTD